MISLAFIVGLAMASAELPVEPPLVPGAIPLREAGRYRSPRSYEQTLDFYRRVFNQTGGVRWRNIVNLPGIKATHAQSLRKKTSWDGLNVYERNGETRIYVLMREDGASEKGQVRNN